MTSIQRESFVFYHSFYESAQDLPRREQLKFYEALFEYALYGREPEVAGASRALFKALKPQIDANNRRYENGCKGGRPKQNQNKTKPKPNHNQDITKAERNDNDNDNDNVNDNENGNVSGNPSALSPAEELIMFVNERGGRAFQLTEKNVARAERLLGLYDEELIYYALGEEIDEMKKDPAKGWMISPKVLFDPDNFEITINKPAGGA